jgi:hypothetical protein
MRLNALPAAAIVCCCCPIIFVSFSVDGFALLPDYGSRGEAGHQAKGRLF